MESKRLIHAILLVTVCASLSSCTDSESPVEPDSGPVLTTGGPDDPTFTWTVHSPGEPPPRELRPDGVTRWDAPWWDMTDEELADRVADHDGRVIVGFKEGDARGGVDEWGRVLVSHGTAREGVAYLRSLEDDFVLLAEFLRGDVERSSEVVS